MTSRVPVVPRELGSLQRAETQVRMGLAFLAGVVVGSALARVARRLWDWP